MQLCYCTAAVAPRLVPPLKRPRLMVAQTRSIIPNPLVQASIKPAQPVQNNPLTDELKTYSNPDILICGNCREMFTELQELVEHKKSYCKLRFTCKCSTVNGLKPTRKDAASLLCVQCKDSFQSAWDLMVHVQAAHMINIYELGVPKVSNGTQHSSPLASPAGKEDEMEQQEELLTTESRKLNGMNHHTSDAESNCTSPDADEHVVITTACDATNGFSPTIL